VDGIYKMTFNFTLPVNILFGRGRIEELGIETVKLGTRALLVISTGSAKRSGLLERVTRLLTKSGVSVTVFDRVQANPLTTTAYEGVQAAAAANCEVVVGVGGGSIMDAAKAIAFAAVNDGDISDYIFGRKVGLTALPIVLAPTTCGTGSEGNCFAVLTNPDNGDKKSLRCSAITPKASIIDPELMQTLPKRVLAAVGFDALCHCMEAFLSQNGNPVNDALALKGAELVAGSLPRLYASAERSDVILDSAWDDLSLGATLGGVVIGVAGVTAPHGLEHPASGLRNIVHGEGLSALTPVILEQSATFAPAKLEKIAAVLGGTDCVVQIRGLLTALELPTRLSQLGITERDIPWMAENAEKVSAAGLNAHPRVFTRSEIEQLYRDAM
jgi:alcohol dehydrogenase class IV